ncbi:MAG: YggT family protein [Anaerolineae bacterium]|nr:YggT family protein [Anaerolineae bacterium]
MSFLYTFVVVLERALTFAIFARIILSWLPIDRSSRLVTLILDITEPILGPIRRVVPSIGGLDLSPMIGLILIQMVGRMLLTMLARFA